MIQAKNNIKCLWYRVREDKENVQHLNTEKKQICVIVTLCNTKSVKYRPKYKKLERKL